MRRTVRRGLTLFTLLLALGACSPGFSFSGFSAGTEVCGICRLSREVVRKGDFDGELIEEELKPTDCSRWVAAHLPEHQHTWLRTGCWQNGGGIACFETPMAVRVPSDRWLAELQAATPERLAHLQRLATSRYRELTEADREELTRLREAP